MTEASISDAEWRVMQVIWKTHSATAAEVIEDVTPATGWSHRTVRTLLGRLVDKGVLSAEQDGNRYLYTARISKERCVREASVSFLERVFSGKPTDLLLHFVRDARLSPEEAERLKALLDDKIKQKRTVRRVKRKKNDS